jgi:Ser-tRNA(Ala) deacylase AlaX
MDDDETIPLEQRNLSPRQFREVENLSPNSMQKLEEIQAEYAAKLEAERKAQIEKMSVLGKLGTKSPKHPCNKNKKRVR